MIENFFFLHETFVASSASALNIDEKLLGKVFLSLAFGFPVLSANIEGGTSKLLKFLMRLSIELARKSSFEDGKKKALNFKSLVKHDFFSLVFRVVF